MPERENDGENLGGDIFWLKTHFYFPLRILYQSRLAGVTPIVINEIAFFMTGTIHSLPLDEHVIVVTLSAREVLRIAEALAEHEEDNEETLEKYGYSKMAKDFNDLWRHLENGGYLDKEYEHLEKNEPW